MVRVLQLIVFLSLTTLIVAQEDSFLTPQNKAYIYHTVRKSPILENNIGRYIVYTGKEITLPNGEINYDSTEQVIINEPSLLRIYSSEIRKAPKGILAELSNKVALWELNKVLKAQRSKDLKKEGLEDEYEEFELYLIKELPEQAIKNRENGLKVHPKILKLNNPMLTFNDKAAMLEGFASWTDQQKMQVITAYNSAINKWVEKRSFELFKKLGGTAEMYHNVLTAAGDGSNTSGMFEEREKDERGRYNKGLPKAVGLFPYDPYIGRKPNSKKNKDEILPMGYTIHTFDTPGNGKKTNMHFDVWGYNSEKQTTVVIEKGGKYYPLFGSAENRFLSPDSTFGKGVTYYTLIKRVRKDMADLEDKISGRKGLDHWIEYHEERKQDKLLEIDKTEKELNDIRYSTITTNDKKYTTDSQRKKRKKRQEKVVLCYSQLAAIKKKIRELKEEKEEILTKKQALARRLQQMYDLVGEKWVPFKVSGGFYTYEDSAKFDILTQEFTFPPSNKKETFQVKLLAIPISHLSSQYDEVMLHMNITDAKPLYTAQVQLELNDVFDSDGIDLETDLLSSSDSIAVKEFFEALQEKKMYFNIIARGNGIGELENGDIKKKKEPETLDQYPGSSDDERRTAREDSVFKSLRTTTVTIFINRCTTLEINSFTDPVKSNFTPPSSDLAEMMDKYQLTHNEMLSAYRTFKTLQKLKRELNVMAGKYLDRPTAKDVIDRLNETITDSRISVGKTSFKYEEFKEGL
tara:strand:- start:30954 stop:33191 length:2238 start_codon:yes stop_codon:yes gene_type:complete